MPRFFSRQVPPNPSSSSVTPSTSLLSSDASYLQLSPDTAQVKETTAERVVEDVGICAEFTLKFIVGFILFSLILLVGIAVLVYFLVRTPSVSVDSFRIGDPSNCTLSDPSCVPIYIILEIENPNIIGADLKGNFTFYEADNNGYIGFAEFDRTSIGATSKSPLSIYIELQGNDATAALFQKVIIEDNSFPIKWEGEVEVYLGALHPTIPFPEQEYTILGIGNYTNTSFTPGFSYQDYLTPLLLKKKKN